MSAHLVTDRSVDMALPFVSMDRRDVEITREKKASFIYQRAHEKSPGASIPLFTSAATSAQDVDGDTSYILREGCNFTGQILTLPSLKIQIPSTINIGASGPSSALFSAVGISTSFNVVMGAIGAKNAYDRFQVAKEQGSDIHQLSSGIDIVKAGSQAAAGLVYIPYRFCSMATSILALDGSGFATTSPLGSATYGLGYFGNALFGIFYACMGVNSLINVLRACSFSAKIWKEGDLSNASDVGNVTKIVSFLKDRLVVTAKGTLQSLQKAHANDPNKMKAELKELALRSICRSMESTLKEAIKEKIPGASLLSKEQIQIRAEQLLAELDMLSHNGASNPTAELSAMMGLDVGSGLSFTELIGLDCKTCLTSSKLETELTALVGEQGVTLLKEALDTSLLERLSGKGVILQRALEEAAELINQVRSHVKRTICLNTGLFLAGILGTVATVFSLIPTALITVTETIVSSALWLLCTFVLISIDVGSLFGAQNGQGPIGKYDKELIWISSAVGLTSLIISSIVASVFSMGIVPMVIGIVIGIFWFMNNINSYFRLHQKQKKYEREHPTLASFGKNLDRQLQNEALRQDSSSIFKTSKNLTAREKKALKLEVARLAGIEKPLERESLKGRHGLVLPTITPKPEVGGDLALQKELEDRLQLAPGSTLRILEEIASSSLQGLCKALHRGDKNEALEIFRALDPKVKTLVADRIALVYGFGEMYFDQHIVDSQVLRSVEKAYKENKGSITLRALYDQLWIIAQRSPTEEEILQAKALFKSLSLEEISLVELNIYHKRARKRSSRHFATITLENMQKALNNVSKERSAIEVEQRRDFLVTGLKVLSLPLREQLSA